MTSTFRMLVLDTNVWLDAFLPARAGHATASSLIARAQACDVSLLYPVHTLPDVFYFVFAHTKHEIRQALEGRDEYVAAAARTTAWESVNTMREIATAVGAGQSDVWLACKAEYLHNDVEDNLVLAAVRRAKADCLVTSDKGLLEHASLACVAAMSPEDALGVLSQA